MPILHRLSARGLIAYGHDIAMAALSFLITIYLREGEFTYVWDIVKPGTLVFTLIATVVFWASGLYRGVWRYASMNDLMAITRAVSLTLLVFILVMFAWTRLEALPRSAPFINWFVLMALLGGPRFIYRVAKDRRVDLGPMDTARRVPVLLVGAGDEAELFIRSLQRDEDGPYRVVGIVSLREGRVGRMIHGVEVLTDGGDVTGAIKKLGTLGGKPQRLILTRHDVDGPTVRALLDEAAQHGLSMARLPRLTDFRPEGGGAPAVMPIAVEDLLGRPQTPLDRNAMRDLVKGRRVLVTGAGGSIGSELARQIADFDPAHLGLLEVSEFALYSIDREIQERSPDVARRAIIADVRDRERIATVVTELKPELVFHAAALKHVPLVEDNPFEGVRTNVAGTVSVADACRRGGVEAMVMISTDKAVNPTSVMGATKRVAERYCQARDVAGGTRFVTVRFGNVLGSTGSVVPLFQRQLAMGGPLTVTHPDMTRYFMTVREAVELVLQASVHGLGHEDTEGRIFVLEMGEPVKIVDLARQMIRLAGLRPDEDVEIEFSGVRPGEKLFEEIFHGSEPPVKTATPGVLLAAPRADDGVDVGGLIEELQAAAAGADRPRVSALIGTLVPEYTPDEEAPARAASEA